MKMKIAVRRTQAGRPTAATPTTPFVSIQERRREAGRLKDSDRLAIQSMIVTKKLVFKFKG